MSTKTSPYLGREGDRDEDRLIILLGPIYSAWRTLDGNQSRSDEKYLGPKARIEADEFRIDIEEVVCYLSGLNYLGLVKAVRKYGKPPFNVAVIHGGPGAGGEMAPVAKELATCRGVLEPIQTATSVEGQVKELRRLLERSGDFPITLVGFSWGAWLGIIFAAEHPKLLKKLIIVGSGPFEERYARIIQKTRLSRLSEKERGNLKALVEVLNSPAAEYKSSAFAHFGALISKADAYAPTTVESEAVDYQPDIYKNVWPEAAKLRRSGRLLSLCKGVKCQVVAIHGDYDPHPAEGVRKPLSAVIKNFRFILLKNCGHRPWIEREAKNEFYWVLRREVFGE